jgi:hypothetical protein
MLWRTIVFLRMGPSPDRKHRDQWRAILSIFAKYASHAPRLGRKHRDPVEAPSPQDKEY